MNSKQTAASYCRFSTEKQTKASLVDQRRVCDDIARREGITITHHFEDSAISGGTAQRSGYQALLAAARRGEFDFVIAEDASRLWREMAEQWRAVKELADLGIGIIGNGIDTRREAESHMLLAVNGVANESFRADIARRTLRGLEGRSRAHKSTGGRCFGYVPEYESSNCQVEVDPTQAAVVVRIFEDYVAGLSPLRIARELNREGIPSPGSYAKRTKRRSTGWQASAIAGDAKRGVGILRNERYTGTISFGRARWKRGAADSKKRKVIMREAPLYSYPEERLRIVSSDLFRRAQERLAQQSQLRGSAIRAGKRRRAAGAGRPSGALLSGMLRCGQCAGPFTVVNERSYGCASHVNGRCCPGTRHYVRRQLIESSIIRSVQEDVSSAESIRRLREFVKAELIERDDDSALSTALSTESEIRKELARLAALVAAGKATEGALIRCNELTRELHSAPQIPATRLRQGEARALADQIVDEQTLTVENLQKLMSNGDVDRARDALRRLTGEIRLVEAPEGTHLVATYDLGIDQLVVSRRSQPRLEQMGGLSELVVAGARFPYFRRTIALL